MKLLHQEDALTCPLVLAPQPVPGSWMTNRHLLHVCEDCSVLALSRMNLGQVEDGYHAGTVTQDGYEGYGYAWAVSTPRFTRAELLTPPEVESARRVARKLFLIRGEDYPAEIAPAPVAA
jgi:hypothetical protein